MCNDFGQCSPRPEGADGDPDTSARAIQLKQEREAARMRPRLTIHGSVTFSSMVNGELTGLGVAAAVGYRQGFSSFFGLHARIGAGVADVVVSNNNSSSSSSSSSTAQDTSMTEVFGELCPYFGPFGRFYVGPMVWYSHFGFGDNALHSDTSVYRLPDVWKGGAGVDMGLLLLSREQLDINWRIKTSLNNQLPARLEFGVGYHFM
jgi:hypothetical protein